MEELAGEGEFQGGAIDIMTTDDVATWGVEMKKMKDKLKI
jgi:cobaltochelatase CobN